MRLPDFVIIGAAKSGTTSLYQHLQQREDIFLSTPKEPEFFARDDRYSMGIDKYAELFADARPEQRCGEASTIYSLAPHFPETARRLASAVPQARLIYLMREPVARAYSFYGQLVKNYQRASRDFKVHRTFEDCLAVCGSRSPRERFFAPFDLHLPDTPGIFLDGSDYALQIRHYLEHFPLEQMLFLTHEEFAAQPAAVLARVYAHIGARADVGRVARPPEVNVAARYIERTRENRFARTLTSALPALRGITRRLPREMRIAAKGVAFRLAGGTAHADLAPPPMLPETRDALHAHFAAKRAELAQLTGIDLDQWWRP